MLGDKGLARAHVGATGEADELTDDESLAMGVDPQRERSLGYLLHRRGGHLLLTTIDLSVGRLMQTVDVDAGAAGIDRKSVALSVNDSGVIVAVAGDKPRVVWYSKEFN